MSIVDLPVLVIPIVGVIAIGGKTAIIHVLVILNIVVGIMNVVAIVLRLVALVIVVVVIVRLFVLRHVLAEGKLRRTHVQDILVVLVIAILHLHAVVIQNVSVILIIAAVILELNM